MLLPDRAGDRVRPNANWDPNSHSMLRKREKQHEWSSSTHPNHGEKPQKKTDKCEKVCCKPETVEKGNEKQKQVSDHVGKWRERLLGLIQITLNTLVSRERY